MLASTAVPAAASLAVVTYQHQKLVKTFLLVFKIYLYMRHSWRAVEERAQVFAANICKVGIPVRSHNAYTVRCTFEQVLYKIY